MKKILKNLKELCKMCGLKLPKSYPSTRCWICLRIIWEKDYHRYYLNIEKDNRLWEEVQAIRGLFAFGEVEKPIIEKAMVKERKKLQNLKFKLDNKPIVIEF